MEKLVYTVKEVAQILCIGKNKVYDLIHQKKLSYIRFGWEYRIPKKALENFIDEYCMSKVM